jgi:hypothetical protein
MRRLTGQEIVHIWEVGFGQHALDRAITILRAAFPEVSRETLASLRIGQRDACLFAIREQLFGSRLSSLATCPACSEQIEFVLNMTELPITPSIEPVEDILMLTTDDGTLQFRLPNSLDLAAIVTCHDISTARLLLAQRCILQANRDGKEVPVEELPETLIATMAAYMDHCDPLAAIVIPLDCIACGHSWHILFDIIPFFWTEIAAQARRLLREVHTLACQYGWREADILAMSAIRRQFYLEMVT